MSVSNAYSALCLFILKDDQLHVLLDRTGDTPVLPIAEAMPDQDIDLAFTCRRISKNLIGEFDYQLWPIHTYSGQRTPVPLDVIKYAWPILQVFAGIGRAPELPEGIDLEAFIPFDDAVDMVDPPQASILYMARTTLKEMAGTSKLPAMLLAREFTLPEMRVAYEVVSEMPILDAAFRRKVLAQNIITETGVRRGLQTRPAKTYSLIGVRYDFERNLVFSDTKN